MILGIGTDIFDVARIERELQKDDRGMVDTVFSAAEIAYCDSRHYPALHYAARFAAKEAVVKALSAGGESGLYLADVEIVREDGGQPRMVLHGRLEAIAARLQVTRIHVSLSHTHELATAFVIIES